MEVDGKRRDDDIVSELCEPCQKGNVSTQAGGYCIDCEEHMCQSCFQRHLKLKLCRNHVLGAIKQGRRHVTQKQEDKCKKHLGEAIKYYCRSHEEVACGDCLVAFHQSCETKFIRDLVENINENSDFKNILKEVDNLKDLKAKIEIALEQNRNENTEFHDRAIQGIQQCRTEINTWLNKVTSQIEEEEMQVWKENEIVLSKLDDWIKTVSDMIDKVTDEISIEKFRDEHLFISVIKYKSEIREFAKSIEPEIKTSLKIKSFTFEPNQSPLACTNSAMLGVIKVPGRYEEDQPIKQEEQTGPETENVGAGDRCRKKTSEDLVRDELEKELIQMRQMKEKYERLQQSYNTLKKDLEDKVSLLSKEKEEREKSIRNHGKTVVLLKEEISSLQSQLGGHNNDPKPKAMLEHYREIRSLKAQFKEKSENHEEERKRLLSQIQDLKRQIESADMTYQLPDPRASGFDVGKRVKDINLLTKGRTGKVTAVVTSGHVDVVWDSGMYGRYAAGAGGQFDVELV